MALLVDGEAAIRRCVRIALQAEGALVRESPTMRKASVDVGTMRPDLVILNFMLPDGHGHDFIRELREWSGIPVIVLSANVAEAHKVQVLDAGADDYLTRPFGIPELLARVRATLRRRHAPAGLRESFHFGEIEIDLSSRIVRRCGETIHLTRIEYRLLQLLVANAPRVLAHRSILREVWGPSHVEHNHYVRIYMASLRRKLEADPPRPRHLLTEPAVGYRLMV